MKIVVLAGGISTERDVSLITGSMVYRALREKGYEVILLDVFFGYEGSLKNNLFLDPRDWSENIGNIGGNDPDINTIKSLRGGESKCYFGPNVIELCQQADITFMALHGENGENGKIQAAFDLFGIKYTGTGYLSSALSLDKNISKTLFVANGIPTPAYHVIRRGQNLEMKVQYPIVVKTCCGGSSVGVYIANNELEYEDAVRKAFSYEEEIIIEEYVAGREFSVGVVDGMAYPIIEIAPIEGFYDYKNKYQAGSAVETCPADLSQELTKKMQEIAEQVFKALGLSTYARMDFLLSTSDEIYCLEANTLPGMTPTSLLPQEARALGMSFLDLCEKIIQVSMAKYE